MPFNLYCKILERVLKLKDTFYRFSKMAVFKRKKKMDIKETKIFMNVLIWFKNILNKMFSGILNIVKEKYIVCQKCVRALKISVMRLYKSKVAYIIYCIIIVKVIFFFNILKWSWNNYVYHNYQKEFYSRILLLKIFKMSKNNTKQIKQQSHLELMSQSLRDSKDYYSK